MREWIISLASVVLIFCVATIILPEGKTGKLVKSVFSALIFLIMLKPVVNFDFNNVEVPSFSAKDSMGLQTNYLDYVLQQKISNYQINCKKLLLNYGIKEPKVRIEYSVDNDYSITIDFVEIECMIDSESNVNNFVTIEKAKQSICEYMIIDREKVKINVK